MNHVREVAGADFSAAVIERSHHLPVLVDFWAEWCGPCKTLGPTLERLAAEGGGAWELAKVDVDQNQELAAQFGVQGIPTVVAFRDGEVANRFTGALPESQVRQFLESILPSELDNTTEWALSLLEAGDAAGAEEGLRAVLETDPTHETAGIGLAGLLLDRSDRESALAILGLLVSTEAVRQMAAIARFSGGGDLDELAAAVAGGTPDQSHQYAVALAASGQHELALEILVGLVALKAPEASENARLAALDLFEILGPTHSLTVTYRRRLASALF